MSGTTLRDRAADVLAEMKAIVDASVAENRDLTIDEIELVEKKAAEHKELQEAAGKAASAAQLVANLTAGQTADSYADQPEQWQGKSSGSLGMAIAASKAFADFRKARPSGASGGTPIDLEAHNVGSLADIGIGAKADLTTATGQPRATRLPGLHNELIDYPFSFLDLIGTGTTQSASIEYARVVSETNNAAIVPEGELKPLSDLTTDIADAKVHTFADGFVATNQFLADEPALAAFMQSRLPIHLRAVTEDKILNGAGGAGDVEGLLHTTGVQSQAFDTDALTSLARGLEKLEVVNVEPQAIVMHPSDIWSIRLLKNRGTEGDYLAGGPFSRGDFQLWGVRVVKSFRIAKGTYAMGNWKSINLLEREPLSVLAFNQHEDFARHNKVYVRAEYRGMVLNYAPREFVLGQLAAPAGP